jgi:hypothetical protein
MSLAEARSLATAAPLGGDDTLVMDAYKAMLEYESLLLGVKEKLTSDTALTTPDPPQLKAEKDPQTLPRPKIRDQAYWRSFTLRTLQKHLIEAGQSQNAEILDEMIDCGLTTHSKNINMINFGQFLWDNHTPPEESVGFISFLPLESHSVLHRRTPSSLAGRTSRSATRPCLPR